MDEMIIKSSWTKAILTKIICKLIKDKLGIDSKIDLGDISVCVGDKTVDIHLSLDAKVDKDKLFRKVTGQM